MKNKAELRDVKENEVIEIFIIYIILIQNKFLDYII